MGKTMDKGDVIYGKVPLKQVSWTKIVEAASPIAIPGSLLTAAKTAVSDAKKEQLTKPYVKVGPAGSDLVLRIKEDKTLGKEIDAVLVKNYKQAVSDLEKRTAGVINEINLILNNSVDEQLKGVPGMFQRVRALLQQGKLSEAENLLVPLRTRFVRIKSTLVYPQEMIRVEAERVNVDPKEIDMKKLNARIAKSRAELKSLLVEFAKVENEFELLAEQQGINDPAPSKNDRQYQTDYQEVVDKFKETLEGLKLFPPKMTKAAGIAKSFPTQCQTADDPAAPLKVAGQLFQAALIIEKQSKDALFSIRERAGECCTLRDNKNLEDADSKKLQPFMTRGMSINQKVIALKEEMFDLLEEGLDTLVERFDDTMASDLLARVRKGK